MRERIRSWTLFLGVLQILAGCLVGLVPASAVPWFRGILMAHIELVANGMLMIVLGLTVRYVVLGARALRVWFVSLQLGTWLNGAAGIAAALSGSSSRFLPTITQTFPPPHRSESMLVSLMLVVTGVAILVTLVLTAWGLRPGQSQSES